MRGTAIHQSFTGEGSPTKHSRGGEMVTYETVVESRPQNSEEYKMIRYS